MPAVDADGAGVQRSGGPAGPTGRGSLDRGQIVLTAVAFIDDRGVNDLTMRRLGSVLGVEAMALYRHVANKEDLLDAVVEHLVDDMRASGSAGPGWQEFLRRLAHDVRRVALMHPRAFPLVVSTPPEAPWLRPPLRSLDWVDEFLDQLGRTGFSDRAAVAGYRAFTSFLLGHLLLEAGTRGAELSPLDELDQREQRDDAASRADDLAGHPTLRRLRAELSYDRAAVEFDEALEELLGRLARLRGDAGG